MTERGLIRVHQDPDMRPLEPTCKQKIRLPPGTLIELEFTSLELCANSSLTVSTLTNQL